MNLTRELAAQWARKGVRVNALAPGWFPSEMTAEMFADDSSMAFVNRNCPMARTGEPHELDGALLFLCSDASSYVHGPGPHHRRRLDRPVTFLVLASISSDIRSNRRQNESSPSNESEEGAEQLAGSGAFGVGRAELGGDEVGDAGFGEALDAGADRSSRRRRAPRQRDLPRPRDRAWRGSSAAVRRWRRRAPHARVPRPRRLSHTLESRLRREPPRDVRPQPPPTGASERCARPGSTGRSST